MIHPAWLALLAALSLVACKADPGELRREADVLSRAVTVLRDAPNDQKGAPLSALSAAKCTPDDLCELKRACVEAYELHQRSLEAISAVRNELSDQTAPVTPKAATLLESARQDLEKSKELTETCARRQADVVHSYGL